MYEGLLHLHSFLRWIIVVLMIWSLFAAFSGVMTGKSFGGTTRNIFLFTLIAVHIQVIIGLGMYFMSPLISEFRGAEDVMSASTKRYWVVEHIVGMIVGALVITAGWSRAKRKETDKQKFRSIAIMYLLGFILIMATIPWPFREMGIARDWF
jgi:hypothetical protein